LAAFLCAEIARCPSIAFLSFCPQGLSTIYERLDRENLEPNDAIGSYEKHPGGVPSCVLRIGARKNCAKEAKP
jgi:hypothetical protein